MNILYTAVGRLQLEKDKKGYRHPIVTLNRKQYVLDVQEMILWTVLNWRILSPDELKELYRQKSLETGFSSEREVDECICKLLQRGLIASGKGETAADALYWLLSELYIIPISQNIMLRIVSFVKLSMFGGVPISVTRKILKKDRRSKDESYVMRLARHTVLSTAEIIKCADRNITDIASEDEMVEALYHDEYTTSGNIAHTVRLLPKCRPVLVSVANLYMRKQIIFERM